MEETLGRNRKDVRVRLYTHGRQPESDITYVSGYSRNRYTFVFVEVEVEPSIGWYNRKLIEDESLPEILKVKWITKTTFSSMNGI